MPSDTAIVRLLYAIISQKCLKDIDWNKVAQDPVLAQEITNGHAARMRYSRFKKQMEGNQSSSRKPRKARVLKSEKSSSSQLRNQKREALENVKEELNDQANASFQGGPYGDSFTSNGSSSSARDMQTPDPVTGLSISGFDTRVKNESFSSPHHVNMHTNGRGAGPASYMPATPLTTLSTPTHYAVPGVRDGSASPSPGSSFDHVGNNIMDDFTLCNSFESHQSGLPASPSNFLGSGDPLYGEMAGNYLEVPHGAGYNLGAEFEPGQSWDQHTSGENMFVRRCQEDLLADEVNVKREPQWEDNRSLS